MTATTDIDISFLKTDSKAALYERTADWFRKNPDRWITGSIMSFYKYGEVQEEPCFCAVGGMHAALTDPPKPRKIDPWEREVLGIESAYLDNIRDIDAEHEVVGAYSDIVTFNDGPCTDVNHLIETLDKIASVIRAKDGTTKPAPKPDLSILEGSKAKLYEGAANWLEAHPGQWTRYNLIVELEGKASLFCAVGAMHACMTDPPKPRLLRYPDEVKAVGNQWFETARDFEAETKLTGGYASSSELSGGIVFYNDNQTTVEPVIAKLREIAAHIRAKETLAAVVVPNIPKRTGKQFSKTYQPSAESKAKVMSHVYRKRLLKLADVTEAKETEGRFWFGSYVGGKDELGATGWFGKANLSCGTSACAMGWATTVPAFRKIGLYLRKSYSGSNGAIMASVRVRGEEDGSDGHNGDVWGGMKVFGIDSDEYFSLFIPGFGAEVRNVNEDLGINLSETTSKTSGKVIADRIRTFANAKFPAKRNTAR